MFKQQQSREIQSKTLKELVREYETSEGGKVREIGPLVYGYSVTIGPDGKPKVREFGNIRSSSGLGGSAPGARAQLRAEKELIVDIITTDKEVRL
jgi:HSP20 family protein